MIKKRIRKRTIKPEDAMQIAVFDWLTLKGLRDISYHCANERKTSAAAGSLLKRKGVTAGVSDIAIMRARGGFNGLFIELKVMPNKPTPKQIAFIKTMNKEGYFATVCYSFDEAIKVIEDYMAGSSGQSSPL